MSRQLDKIAIGYRNGFEYIYNIAKRYNLIIIFTSFAISGISLINSLGLLSGKHELQIKNYISFFSFIWFLTGIILKKMQQIIEKRLLIYMER